MTAGMAQTASRPSTAVVAVDFLAIGPGGEPVEDLRPEEVVLKVNSRVREIRSLEFVAMDRRRLTSPDEPALLLPPPYGSSVSASPARTIIVVIEDESIEPGREGAMRSALGMLLTSIGPRDRVAVVTVPHGGLKVDFTTDRREVVEALSQISGQAARDESPQDASCRTRDTLQALTGLLHDLTGNDAPISVLFFSTGLTGPSPMVLPPAGQAGQEQPRIGICLLQPEAFTKVGAAAESARANFFIVPPDASPIAPRSLEGIENLAGVTGGTRIALAAASEVALRRVTAETSGYYLATFTPEPQERNGTNHRIDVRASRPGVVVRTRPGLRIAEPRPSERATPVDMAREMLRVSRVYQELPIRVAGFASRYRGDGGLQIIAIAEPIESSTRLRSAAVGLFDTRGRLVAQWSATESDLRAAFVQAALIAPPGSYRLRAAATDTLGRRGTADYELDASLQRAGPLSLSSLVAGVSRDGRFVPTLHFTTEASAMVQFEIYGGVAGMPLGARLDVVDPRSGKPISATRLILEPGGEPDKFIAKGMLPIGALPDGDFLVRAIVEAEGQIAGTVSRTIRKRAN